MPVDSSGDEAKFYATVDQLSAHIKSEYANREIEGVCFAFPGPFDYAQGISYLTHKFGCLHGKNLRAEFAARFAMDAGRIRFVNDADAFLLGELTQLPSAKSGNTVGITLGTGVGSAFAIDGAIARSGPGVPQEGEIWNLPWKGGIVEDAISTRAIQGAYAQRTGRQISVREIAEACPLDSVAVRVFEEFGEMLGNVLHSVTAEFRPASVIFGGAISRSAELFLPCTARQFGGSRTLQVSTLFEDAALYGAAAHWTQLERGPGKDS